MKANQDMNDGIQILKQQKIMSQQKERKQKGKEIVLMLDQLKVGEP